MLWGRGETEPKGPLEKESEVLGPVREPKICVREGGGTPLYR